jgi:N-acetylmuramoyl-L-alanine amidase
VAEDGTVTGLVDEALRAWHAGAGAWGNATDVNSRSIGIEIANDGASPYPNVQMAAVEALLAACMGRWKLPPERVIAHSDCAPGRKSDPGPRFDWRRLERGGLAIVAAAGTAPVDTEIWRDALRRAGYTAPADDAAMLAAFRLRHCPWAAGPLEPADMGAALDLAARFPVDRGAAPA